MIPIDDECGAPPAGAEMVAIRLFNPSTVILA
jgi:hypothetical protein